MTLDQLRKLSNAELDRLVAERVMNWPKTGCTGYDNSPQFDAGSGRKLIVPRDWSPTHNANDAMEMMTQFPNKVLREIGGEWSVSVYSPLIKDVVCGIDKSFCLAACYAALMAKMEGGG